MQIKLLTKKVINNGNELEKRYQQRIVNNFIWNSRKFFVSLRAGWVAEYYCDRE